MGKEIPFDAMNGEGREGDVKVGLGSTVCVLLFVCIYKRRVVLYVQVMVRDVVWV